MEVAIEAFVAQLNIKLFDDILHDKELPILDRLLESFLDMPEHQILQLGVLRENPLEPIQVALLHAVDQRASPCHKLHEGRLVVLLHPLDLVPKTPPNVQNKSQYRSRWMIYCCSISKPEEICKILLTSGS